MTLRDKSATVGASGERVWCSCSNRTNRFFSYNQTFLTKQKLQETSLDIFFYLKVQFNHEVALQKIYEIHHYKPEKAFYNTLLLKDTAENSKLLSKIRHLEVEPGSLYRHSSYLTIKYNVLFVADDVHNALFLSQ